MSSTILVLPDAHASPRTSNDRFEWFGNLVCDLKPDFVVDIGDFFDMGSLNTYDSSVKKAFNGVSYKEDIAAGLSAQDLILDPIRRAKRKRPKFFRCLGNHENRIVRARADDPVLRSTINLSDLQSSYFGWEELPFLERLEIEGVQFSHYFVSGVAGRPVGGEQIAASLLNKNFCSCVQGHSHLFDFAVRKSISGKTMMGLSVGCFIAEPEAWSSGINHTWWSGVVVLNNVEDGCFDLTQISLKSLGERYGNKQL